MYDMIDYPVITLVGRRGSGKSTTTTALAKEYSNNGVTVFCNYKLKGIPYIEVDPDDLSTFPDWLRDGVLILDEAHAKLDAYDFFKTTVKDASLFVTQTRKLKITLILVTQNWLQLPVRFRRLTDYVFQLTPIKEYDAKLKKRVYVGSEVDVFDVTDKDEEYLTTFYIDGVKVFKYFDTDEIIHRYSEKERKHSQKQWYDYNKNKLIISLDILGLFIIQ